MEEAEVERLIVEARESMEAAANYQRELQHRLKGLSQARTQIKESAAQTRETLRQHFQDMRNGVTKMLEERLAVLLQQVEAIELQNIKPLDDCQKVLEHGISTAQDLLREGAVAVSGKPGTDHQTLCNFTNKALHIQLDSLPEVPSLIEVPCLSAQLDDSLLSVARDQISSHGTVASRPPVQIEELTERPGGILVKWCKVDDDFVVQDYRLQYRRHNSGHFEDAYVGHECEFIVLQIDPNVDYQFRVCARGDGRQEWSPWSVPQMGHTCLIPHEWSPGLEGYSLSSRRNIALRNDSPCQSVLYSKSATYFPGQTLTFRVETTGQPDKRDSIGVCVEKDNGCDSMQRDKAVCISPGGAVFVNGKEMTNQLPPVSPGSTITFDMALVSLGPSNNNEGPHHKRRVTISSGTREVVFDWLLEQSCDALYFGCSFIHPSWKVLVF
ncbi:PREDICTED: cytokine receptor-like factor 3 [Nanorana parkeri]|uniref:cytokine receptor-like factor 3 n=1 Tax=Nanorana parkeri TaxID=125878 RepID=UPI000854E905|nr:PREDICTED: cytokine receptor-like factor 3 [Nanorana parkeri]